MNPPPQYDPEVSRDDIRSLKRFFRLQPGVSSKIVLIHYLGPDEFRVFVTRHFFVVVRDADVVWRITEQGTLMA